METLMKKIFFFALMLCCMIASGGISNLKAVWRNGQLFLTWNESEIPSDARFSVWSSRNPITKENIKEAERIAWLINPASACDWWRNKDAFVVSRSKSARSEEIFAGNVADLHTAGQVPEGFIITTNGSPLDPRSGLHVHTPKAGQTGERYFAVTRHAGTDPEILEMTVMKSPVLLGEGRVNGIRFKGNILREQTEGKPLLVELHGRGGGVGVDSKGAPRGNHIIFSDSTLGWREGLPFKFDLRVQNGIVKLILFDRVWTGRKLQRGESPDARDFVPAVNTFWLGYNTNIAVSNNGPVYHWDNYTERLVLRIIQWVQEQYGTDQKRVYLNGGSMGGSGSVQLALHYPDKFAAVYAYVPVYSYSWKRMPKFPKLLPSIFRMQCSIGMFTAKDKVLMPDGTDLLVYGNGALQIAKPSVDMPPLFTTNGRRDMSIPWINNPPFYKAANEARQAFSVNWNNGGHAMTREVPPVITIPELLRYRLDLSYPAFSNSTDNRDYGNGDPDDGDLVGWINRGMKWDNVKDTPELFEMTLSAAHPEMKYPVTCDVTFRRRQQFKAAPGTRIAVEINGEKRETVIDKNGLLTIEKVVFRDQKPIQIRCRILK